MWFRLAVGLAQVPHLQQAAAYLAAVGEIVSAERETGCRFDDGGSLLESVAWWNEASASWTTLFAGATPPPPGSEPRVRDRRFRH